MGVKRSSGGKQGSVDLFYVKLGMELGQQCITKDSVGVLDSRAVLNGKKYLVPSPNEGKKRPARVRAGNFLNGDS